MRRTNWRRPWREGVAQYVVLGAGLDTFAYRNPFAGLRVFEVDFPATQEWKRAMLAEAGIAVPEDLTFVPLDFEHQTLARGAGGGGIRARRAGIFWMAGGGALSDAARRFAPTLATIAQLPAGSGVSFDYAFSPETLSAEGRHGLRYAGGARGRGGRAISAVLYAGGDGGGAAPGGI